MYIVHQKTIDYTPKRKALLYIGELSLCLNNHRQFDKPCFVPAYSNSYRLVLRVVIIYLQATACLFVSSNSFRKVPLP